MTIDTSTLGAPVTDIDDFIASRPGSPCHADALARPDIIDESDDAQRSRLRWAAVPIVIAALVAAWMLGAAGTPDPTLPSPPTTPDGLEGFAELYVATFLTEAGIDATDALDPFAIPIDGIEAMTPYERYVPRSAAIRIDPIGVDYWAVLVAADVLYRTEGGYGPGGVEYFEVAIAATDGGFVATAAPLPVRRPAAVIPYGTYGELRAEADEATVAFMADFLEAYFTDSGRLPRMVTADSGIEAAAPFAAVGPCRGDRRSDLGHGVSDRDEPRRDPPPDIRDGAPGRRLGGPANRRTPARGTSRIDGHRRRLTTRTTRAWPARPPREGITDASSP